MGKTGLPVSASWMSMPVMPIMAARPLLRSAFSFQVLPRKSSSSPTCAQSHAWTQRSRIDSGPCLE